MNIKGFKEWAWVVSIPAIIGILLIVFIYIFRFTVERPEGTNFTRHFRPTPVPFHIFTISLILLIIAVVPLSYYFLSKSLDEKLARNMSLISKLMKTNRNTGAVAKSVNTRSVVLKFLTSDERKVVEHLVSKKGLTLQSEITRMKDMTKLRTHRAVKNLESKEILFSEEHGKTNKLVLAKDIKDILL